jgi:hypothetical protein
LDHGHIGDRVGALSDIVRFFVFHILYIVLISSNDRVYLCHIQQCSHLNAYHD